MIGTDRDRLRRLLLARLRRAGRIALDLPLRGWKAADLEQAARDLRSASVAHIVRAGSRVYVRRWAAAEHGRGVRP